MERDFLITINTKVCNWASVNYFLFVIICMILSKYTFINHMYSTIIHLCKLLNIN
jgi:hypothetical protein